MNLLRLLLLGLLFAAILPASAAAQVLGATTPQQPSQTTRLTYIENRGQWAAEARYLLQTPGLNYWINNNGITYDAYRVASATETQVVGEVVKMSFVGANASANAVGVGVLPGTFNYILGNDPAGWTTNVRRFSGMAIARLYDKVQAVFYLDQGKPRYDLIVGAGGDPAVVKMAYKGSGHVTVNRAGEAVYQTSVGINIHQGGLFAYQMVDNVKQQIPCSFRQNDDGTLSFQLGSYDRTKPLVIDPLLYSTYIATSEMETPYDIKTDAQGNAYITGMTQSTTYPTSPGAYQALYGGGSRDAFVTKISADGSTLLYSTFIGASGQDIAYGIDVDASGDAYITGTTSSTNFPTTPSAYQAAPTSGTHGFVVRLNANGTAPAYSTCLLSTTPSDIAVDQSGNAYITGNCTAGLANTIGFWKPIYGGGASDAFALKLEPGGGTRAYATFIGGTGADRGVAIALDKDNNAYITGTTDSSSFPSAAGAYSNVVKGGRDVFITKLNGAGTGMQYSTLIGGTANDMVEDIAVDINGSAYITGSTVSLNYPTFSKTKPFQDNQAGNDVNNQYGDAFVTKFNPAGTAVDYSTFLGGVTGDGGTGIYVDRRGYAYVTGFTGSVNFPVKIGDYDSEFEAPGEDPLNYQSDAFYTKLNQDGSNLLYSTFLGGEDADSATAITVSKMGDIFVTGHTRSTQYPVTDGAYQTTFGDKKDVFITKFPGVLVSVPNGLEQWCAGTVQQITWESSGIPAFDVYISSDSGQTYNLLASQVRDHYYEWPIPPTQKAGIAYRVRVEESGDPVLGSYSDLGDMTFTISSLPQITLEPGNTVQPAGGTAVFRAGASSIPAPTVLWQVSGDGGQTWTDVPNGTTPILTLNSLQVDQNSTIYRAIFTNLCGSDTTANAVLTVVGLTLLEPNGGQKFCTGSKVNIRWGLANYTGSPVYNLAASSDGGKTWATIINGILANNYEWTLPRSLAASAQYRIRVTLTSGAVIDISDSNFTINGQAVVTRNPSNASVELYEKASFTAEAGGLPEPQVQWQISTNKGQTWTNVNGGARTITDQGRVNSRFDLPRANSADSGTMYRAIFINECGSDTTAPATLVVYSFNPSGVDDMDAGTSGLTISALPNPAAGDVVVALNLPRSGKVRVMLNDMNGRLVRRIAEEEMSAGQHQFTLDAASLPNGTYTCTLLFGNQRRTVKVQVVK
ncbi:MAG: SBBP repeat-containing protein [Armatimonadetes bacterium]|nr:SBBP repeat-containing protein [Armatimonadota bacterium]